MDSYKTSEARRGYARQYRERNPERAREAVRNWREQNREADRAAARRWIDEHPDWVAERRRRLALSRKYGITVEEYNEMWEAQDGKCAICGVFPEKRRLSVDHNHETGKVRALLCVSCNTGVGYFERPISLGIVAYLDQHDGL